MAETGYHPVPHNAAFREAYKYTAPTDVAMMEKNLAAWLVAGINPSLATVRQFFDDIFSVAAGASTRAALLALWKRFATRGERVFATGTGSDATPGNFVLEGSMDAWDIIRAVNA